MARLPLAPTKSNLIRVKEQLATAREGYELLEQKREILVMELMRTVEQVKILERNIAKRISTAYPALKRLILRMGREKADRLGRSIDYGYQVETRKITIAGIPFPAVRVNRPKMALKYSFAGSSADSDKVMSEFFEFLALLAEMASVRTVVWRLAEEVRKTQRRVNALEKMVIPRTVETKLFIESALEEHEREAFFILKLLKARSGEGG